MMLAVRPVVAMMLAVAFAPASPVSAAGPGGGYDALVQRLLSRAPLIDGHNDLPWALTSVLGDKAGQADSMTDGREADRPFRPISSG